MTEPTDASGAGTPDPTGASGTGSPDPAGTSGAGSPDPAGASGTGSPDPAGTSGAGSPDPAGTSGAGSPDPAGASGTGPRLTGALPRLGVLIAAVCLGSAALLLVISGASPATAAFLRCGLAVLTLAPFAIAEVAVRGRPRAATTVLAAVSGAFLGLDYIMWAQSVYDAGVGVSTVLISVQVIVFPALVWGLHRLHPGRLFLACVPVMLIGMLLTGGILGADPTAAAPARGAVLGVLSGVLYGVYIYGTHRARVLDPGLIVTPVLIATAAAGCVTLLGGLILGGLDFDLGLRGWAAMIALAILGQAGAWGLLAVFSTRLPVTETASLMLAQPLTAVLLGTLAAGERLTLGQWLGVAIVIAVVWLVSAGPRLFGTRAGGSRGRGLRARGSGAGSSGGSGGSGSGGSCAGGSGAGGSGAGGFGAGSG